MKLKAETRKNIRSGIPYFNIIVIMTVYLVFLQFLFSIVYPVPRELLACFYFTSMFPFLFLFVYYQRKGLVKYEEIGLVGSNLKKNVFIGFSAGVLAGVTGWVLLYFLGVPTEGLGYDAGSQVFLVLFLPMVICAPVWEEFFTRGLFFAFVEKSIVSNMRSTKIMKELFLISAVSLFFLLAHFGREPRFLLVIFVTSVIYTVAYHRTRNLIVPIIAHSVYNLLIILRVFI
jgi:membrane protease YdiL (CAAX protease family)